MIKYFKCESRLNEKGRITVIVLPPFEIREQIAALVRHHGLPIWIFEKPDPLKALVKARIEVNTQWLALLAICGDQEEMLYQIDCFETYCKEHDCWGRTRSFENAGAKIYYLYYDIFSKERICLKYTQSVLF